MENYTILTCNHDEYKEDYAYRGTYLHGQIEEDFGYDIFAFSRQTSFKTGVHLIDIDDRTCLFFLWRGNNQWRGLLCYADDYDYVEHATRAFNDRDINI